MSHTRDDHVAKNVGVQQEMRAVGDMKNRAVGKINECPSQKGCMSHTKGRVAKNEVFVRNPSNEGFGRRWPKDGLSTEGHA